MTLVSRYGNHANNPKPHRGKSRRKTIISQFHGLSTSNHADVYKVFGTYPVKIFKDLSASFAKVLFITFWITVCFSYMPVIMRTSAVTLTAVRTSKVLQLHVDTSENNIMLSILSNIFWNWNSNFLHACVLYSNKICFEYLKVYFFSLSPIYNCNHYWDP